jgi:hypothetical protein
MIYSIIEKIFFISLLVALIISFYFFIDLCIFKNKTHIHIFDTWQFPMLLAIFIDIVYVHKKYIQKLV